MAKRKLRLWEALALSLGLMGPTLAMAGNGQGIIGTVGKAVPLVFLLGFIGVALVAYGFIRLTQRYNHAGSAYALVGATLGPRAGFVAGFALFGTYLFFTICTAAVFGAFLNALLASLTGEGTSLGYGIAAVLCLLVTGYMNTRDTTTVSRSLLAIEGVGIAAMLVLVIAVFGQGGAASTGVDLSTFTPDGIGLGAVLAAVVAAFLS
jgi:amino acid transporter